MPLDTLAQILGVKKATFIAGLIGGVLSLKFIEGLSTWPQKVSTALGGAFAATYLAPFVVDHLAIKSGEYGVAFVIGLFGMSFFAALTKTIQGTDWSELLKGWFRRGGQ